MAANMELAHNNDYDQSEASIPSSLPSQQSHNDHSYNFGLAGAPCDHNLDDISPSSPHHHHHDNLDDNPFASVVEPDDYYVTDPGFYRGDHHGGHLLSPTMLVQTSSTSVPSGSRVVRVSHGVSEEGVPGEIHLNSGCKAFF